jgi:DNA modification methylase
MPKFELLKGDCLVEMSKINDKSVDMILCDLPYNTLNKKNTSAQWDQLIPFDKLWKEYNRIIKDNGAIVLFGQGMFTIQPSRKHTHFSRMMN